MKNVVGLVLGGGKGTRLYPLTKERSKPAVPLAAKYRLIDIPISNCINSGINRIFLLTQFKSVSLHRHIRQTFKFDRFSNGFVEILAAEQTLHSSTADSDAKDWYQGTADAVRKQLRYFDQFGIDYVLILSGDQLYRMDYEQMLKTHKESGAEVTIAGLPVSSEQARAFGIMKIDDDGRVHDFEEKPKDEETLDRVRTDPAWLDAHGIQSRGRDCLASMGIYLFNRKTLVRLLQENNDEDFGKQIFPRAIKQLHVQMHPFDGYWEDIGTIKNFYDSNLAMTSPNPPFEFGNPNAPIYSRARYLPPTRVDGATLTHSLIADGCVIEEGAVIQNSVIGLRCRIGANVVIKNSILMGADYYQEERQIQEDEQAGQPLVGIGAGSHIEGAIIDKNARVGRNVTMRPLANHTKDSTFRYGVIRDGIIVVEREAILEDGWSLETAEGLAQD